MTTTREDIREWLVTAKAAGATHVIVVVDTFDHEDYPVRVMPEDDVHQVYKDYDGPNMQRVMEIYNLRLDLEMQLAEQRARNF